MTDRVERKIYIIETPPTSKVFQQVVWVASEEELAQAKKERPDLIFRLPLPEEHAVLQGDAEVMENTEIPDIELTSEQKHIMEVINTPMSLHGFGSKKLEIKESE